MLIVSNSFGCIYELRKPEQGAYPGCARCAVRLPWAQGASLTCNKNEVVTAHAARGSTNTFNRKGSRAARCLNYWNNARLFHVPGIRCTLMRSSLMLMLYLRKNATPLRLWTSKSGFCCSFPVELPPPFCLNQNKMFFSNLKLLLE